MTEASQLVVVDHARCLEKRIDNGRAHEIHAPALQVLGDAVGQLCVRVRSIICIQNDLASGKAPEIAVKKAELLLNGEKDLGILDSCQDFAPVADDPRVLHQCLDFFWAVLGDHGRFKVVKGSAERLPLIQNRQPGEPRLKPFQNQHLKEFSVIVFRPSPLMVVVGNVEIGTRVSPTASHHIDGPHTLR